MISRHRALFIALGYAVLGILWITYSDAAVEAIARDAAALTQLQTWKGWLYVAVTAVLIYLLVRGALGAEHRLAASLRSAEERLRLVLDTIPSRVLWKDRGGRYLGGNRHFAEDAGLTDPDEVVGLTDEQMPWRDQLPTIRATDHRILTGDATRIDYELTIPGPDGRPRHEQVTKVPLRGPGGEVTGVLASYQDVTARKAAERQLQHSQKLRAIGELTSGVTHDFKNVLSVIIANAELVERALPPDSEEATAVRDILAASSGAAGMVRKLLGFSRAGDLVIGAADLSAAVREVAPMLSRLLTGRYDLQVAVDAGVPPVLADVDAVEQMLLNLVTNARDAMPEGGEIRIHVRGPTTVWDADAVAAGDVLLLGMEQPPAPGQYVTLEVSDTGPGMSREVADRVVEPYYTTKAPGQGTGLGLSMVYGLMTQHRGYLTLRTAPGAGATFALHFPIAPSAVAPATRRQRPSAAELPRGSETILLVDDQDELRRTGSRVLRRYGYTVLEASTGAEALSIMEREGPRVDLVLSDYIMPGMHGIALLEALTARGVRARLALSSGHAELLDAAAGGEPAAQVLIPKPWTLEELVTGVRDVLDGRRG